MKNIYSEIVGSKNKKLLAILLDPEKIDIRDSISLIQKINDSPATHIFIGGSSFEGDYLDELIILIKEHTHLPILLFPGNPSQITNEADGILFLSLVSGRNPDYLIEHQVNAVPLLKKTNLEVISTAYLLIDSGSETTVQKVSKTKPLDRNNPKYILQTAQASEYLGAKLIYLEAGSGAKQAVPLEVVKMVSQNCSIPLIVGGGIRSLKDIENVYNAGANLIVIGTAFENNPDFFTNYNLT